MTSRRMTSRRRHTLPYHFGRASPTMLTGRRWSSPLASSQRSLRDEYWALASCSFHRVGPSRRQTAAPARSTPPRFDAVLPLILTHNFVSSISAASIRSRGQPSQARFSLSPPPPFSAIFFRARAAQQIRHNLAMSRRRRTRAPKAAVGIAHGILVQRHSLLLVNASCSADELTGHIDR